MLTGIFFGLFVGRRGTACVDPSFENLDLLLRQGVAFGRHPRVGVGGRDFFDQQAVVGISRFNRRTVIAAAADRGRRVQPQFRFLFQRAVAGKTAVPQHRLDVIDVVHFRSGGSSVCQQ